MARIHINGDNPITSKYIGWLSIDDGEEIPIKWKDRPFSITVTPGKHAVRFYTESPTQRNLKAYSQSGSDGLSLLNRGLDAVTGEKSYEYMISFDEDTVLDLFVEVGFSTKILDRIVSEAEFYTSSPASTVSNETANVIDNKQGLIKWLIIIFVSLTIIVGILIATIINSVYKLNKKSVSDSGIKIEQEQKEEAKSETKAPSTVEETKPEDSQEATAQNTTPEVDEEALFQEKAAKLHGAWAWLSHDFTNYGPSDCDAHWGWDEFTPDGKYNQFRAIGYETSDEDIDYSDRLFQYNGGTYRMGTEPFASEGTYEILKIEGNRYTIAIHQEDDFHIRLDIPDYTMVLELTDDNHIKIISAEGMWWKEKWPTDRFKHASPYDWWK